ncbi:WD40 repeat protein [Flavobacterium croceum DSM 17960]|uniref:WD40 repeat protein n=1 Tax=Flavobacterium croceum DSM 17960 TaxID=1121886 RepID=A0A2S4N6Q8_9FLAO|nr:OmpA family protein [Flavobacterium croceum]POS01416.1 WD40 repeat protein [Flavobacterium croceum DSM 17960]
MKKNIIYLGLLLTSGIIYAQNSFTEKADKLFQTYQYVGAIDEYLKIAESKNADTYVFTQLADSYYHIFKNEEAAKWYAKAVENTNNPETYYKYAQTLKSLGKYTDANKQMDVFSKMVPSDSRAIEHTKNPNYIPSLANKSKLFDVSEVNLAVKEQNDFGAFLTNNNELYFVSTRNTTNKKDKWSNQSYLDIYKSIKGNDGKFSEATPVSELNTAFHDGLVSISSDGKTMYFARDGHSEGKFQKRNGNVKLAQQGLYKAQFVDGKWTNIVALPFNSTEYSVTNPSISKDGKTLYFASNMPGGFGESDIWKVQINGDTYGTPENLGAKINSKEKENFPFITDDNILYFASTGKQGFGGFDLYKVNTTATQEPQNLGKPINSEKDDFSFCFNTQNNIGYFSSNRNGFDTIYGATTICSSQLFVNVLNKKTGALVQNAEVAILDAKGNTITKKTVSNKGTVDYDIDCNAEYALVVSAPNFDTEKVSIAGTKLATMNKTVEITPTEVIITDTEVILNPIYFDFNQSAITSQGALELDKLVKVMKANPAMVIFVKSHTDTKGTLDYNLILSQKRVDATLEYIRSKGITPDRISGKGFGSSQPKVECGGNCTEEQDAQNRRSEFVIVKK